MKTAHDATPQRLKNLATAEWVLIASVVFISLSLVLYYMIDLTNAWGLRDWLLGTNGEYFYFHYKPFFFEHYGRDGGFAELAQWSMLAATAGYSLYTAGRFTFAHANVSKFWLILGLGTLLMLLEDAGEVRHQIMGYVQWAANEPDQGLWGTGVEAVFFAILGGLPVYALWRYGSAVKEHGRTYPYVLCGILAHATAAGLSFVGTAFQKAFDRDVYTIMGEKFYEYSVGIGGNELRTIWDTWDAENWWYQIRFNLMDAFVEENIEIIGNAFFLAAVLSATAYYTHKHFNK